MNIYVGNLSDDVSEENLRQAFESFGQGYIQNLFNTISWQRYSMKNEEKETKPRYGIVNFEKRKHPRFNVDLPIEYSPSGLFFRHGNAANASEGGLVLYLSELMEIGQNLMVELFLSEGSKLNIIETLVQVVWKDILSGEGREDYRTGVKLAYITPEDFEKLKHFLGSFSQ